MALKSSLLWFRRNCRKTSSRFFTSRGPRTIRADFCGDTEASSSAQAPRGAPRPLTPAAPKGAQPRLLLREPQPRDQSRVQLVLRRSPRGLAALQNLVI